MSKVFYYYITPVGVLSFNKKYVCVNGKVTKSVIKLRSLLKSLAPGIFSNINMFLFGVYSYEEMYFILLRLCRRGVDGVDITACSSCFVHKASEIFHGQYCDYPPCRYDGYYPF